MPDARRYPRQAAESVRSFLMVRLALHLGLRQKNLRELLLATHILKQTGSYEQASYAIQDTPETVAKHYGRFLPQDKAALAALILNRVWEAA